VDSNNQKAGCGVGGFVVFIIVVVWLSSVFQCESTTRPARSSKDMALVMIQQFTKKRLKAPLTARFEPGALLKVQRHGDHSFSIDSYVDAQNSFGAVIRQHFSCKVLYQGTQWELVSFTFKER